MIEWTPRYIASQIITIFVYVLLGVTFFYKKRKSILLWTAASVFLQIPMFILQYAHSAVAMSVIVFVRSLYMLVVHRENESEEITKQDKMVVLVIVATILACAYFTYEGAGSMLVVVGTLIFTYSVFQKNVFTYKWLNIICCLAWLAYAVYIMSVVQIIFEIVLTIMAVAGTLKHIADDKKEAVMK